MSDTMKTTLVALSLAIAAMAWAYKNGKDGEQRARESARWQMKYEQQKQIKAAPFKPIEGVIEL